MDSDEEDFVFFGTPIERKEDMTSQRKKSVAEAAGQLRSLPPWKHEVRDEEGRRVLHGALTGGLSAGYYNTVGSKEGWTPQSFTSSRKCRAEIKQQNIFNFLDDDERAEMEDQSLGTSSQFDTFGFTAAEITRKQVENDQQKSREENQTRKKPPPAPQMRSKIDSLIFTSDFVKGTKVEETVAPNRDAFTASNSDALCISEEAAEKDNKFELEVENVERPVDLYKAIFSDDSDNEGEETILNHVKKDSPKKIEAANTTLNRLIAGDFLESLGKELGLEVPSGMPYSIKARGPAPPKERPNEKPYEEETALESGLLIDESVHGNLPKSGSILIDRGFSENKSDEVNLEKIAEENSKAKAPSSRKHNWSSSSSSDYEISRKWSRRRRHRSRDSDSASSSDNRDRYHSRSKGSKKKSSREKSSSRRKHSKHHKHSSRDSPSRSRHSTENELAEDRREK